jgi:hypothetical protein
MRYAEVSRTEGRTLQVNDDAENENGGQQVHDVGQVLAVESLAQSELLVWPSDQEVDERNDCTLKLWATTSVDRGRRECFPDDGLANVGRDEERNSASETVSLLE